LSLSAVQDEGFECAGAVESDASPKIQTVTRSSVLGFFLGLVVAGGSYFGIATLAGANLMTAAIVGAVAAVIGAAYSAMAFSRTIYEVGFFSILGYLLDMTWSILNTIAGLLVWIPACRIFKANFIPPNDNSRRSGTFVYDKNPRGGNYDATTIGPVIAGGWSSHEETHVWQARIFGPSYMLSYIIALILNIPFRLITGNTKDMTLEAYFRIPFEDWAYWGGSTSGNNIDCGWWFRGFLVALIYTVALISIPVGIALGILPLWLIGIGVLVLYSVIRAFAPRGTNLKARLRESRFS
jgi:hypothetical protein